MTSLRFSITAMLLSLSLVVSVCATDLGDIPSTENMEEFCQDAIGTMVDGTLVYTDATPLLSRAALTGDVTASAGSNATTIAADAVTYAKMQNVSAASKLLGRGDSGAGDVQEITLGSGLSMSGTTLSSSGGSGVSDGDKGDITVSASGATWTIDNDAVTYAKIQDVSATDRLLGRVSASAGIIEEIEITDFVQTILNDADAATVRGTVGAAASATTITIAGTTNEITSSAGAQDLSANRTWTLSLPATIDLGGKTSLEIPNSSAPTVDADGEIAVDTTVTDFSHGILKYYSGEELAVIAVPIAQLSSPTDGHVIKYNSTNDEFELGAVSTSLSGGAANKVAYWTSSSALSNDTEWHYDATNNIIGFGGTAATAGTNGNVVLTLYGPGLGNAVAPTTGVVDGVQLYPRDYAATKAGLGIKTEDNIDYVLAEAFLQGTTTLSSSMTRGHLIDQAGADNGVLQFLSTGDITHGMTALGSTAMYFDARKVSGNDGGAQLRCLTEATIGCIHSAIVSTETSTKSVNGDAAFIIEVGLKDSTTVQGMSADSNLFAIQNRFAASPTKFIVDNDGDSWQTGSVSSVGHALRGTTSGTLTLNAAATTTSHTLTLPSAQGAANSFLRNDGSGGLSWNTTVVQTNQANTYTTGAQDLGAATSLIVPKAAGAAPTADGDLRYDTTQDTFKVGGAGGTVGALPRVLTVNRVNSQLTNSTTADQDFTTIYTFAANQIVTGRVFRLTCLIQYVTDAAASSRLYYLKLGGTKIFTQTGAVTPGNSVTRSFIMHAYIFGKDAAGAAAEVEGSIDVLYGLNNMHNSTSQPVASIATNGTLALTLGIAFGTSTSGESETLLHAVLEELSDGD